jgi:hypothetical protein
MADDLSAPLGRKRTPAPTERRRFSLDHLPVARLAFGAVALIALGVGARLVLVDEPTGGRPVAEIGLNTSRAANPVQDTVSLPPATITAGPEVALSGMSVSMVGDDIPDGDPAAAPPAGAATNAQGLLVDLVEESENGALPRIAATGETPFEAYAPPASAAANGGRPMIAVVVTGLGLNAAGTAAAIDTLPPDVTLAFAPYGKGLQQATASARNAGHEILLEVPLEPFDYPQSDPGPETLLTGQPPRENLQKLFKVMGRFGGYVGLINHMGARFTSSATDFGPVMEELGARGLGYLDDGSSNRTTAPQLATANAVPFGKADLVLDPVPARNAILDQFTALEARAKERGSAIGVISALPVSVQALAEWARTAEERGYVLVPVSVLMKKVS